MHHFFKFWPIGGSLWLSQNFGRWLGSYEWYFVILWMQVQWLEYHDMLGTIKLYQMQKSFGWTFFTHRFRDTNTSSASACARATWWNLHYFLKKSPAASLSSPLNMLTTRMHSSGMRTARLLPVSPSMHCSGGCTCWGCVPGPGGCTCWGVYLVPGGVPGPGGVYLPGGCTWSGGVYLVGGCTCPGTPPVNRMTDRCKNITLPQTSFAGGNNSVGDF